LSIAPRIKLPKINRRWPVVLSLKVSLLLGNRWLFEMVVFLRESWKMARKIFLIVALVIVLFSLLDCQTVQGIGEDITWVGEKGSELVEK
jgi:predicted small secreted protein